MNTTHAISVFAETNTKQEGTAWSKAGLVLASPRVSVRWIWNNKVYIVRLTGEENDEADQLRQTIDHQSTNAGKHAGQLQNQHSGCET